MNKTVLIVDDIAAIREFLRSALTEMGLRVVGEAANGAEGVALYREFQPDIVLMDLVMPQMDGLQALEAIRAYDQRAIVIMMSAPFQEELQERCLNRGARAFLAKPFDIQRLLEVLNRIT